MPTTASQYSTVCIRSDAERRREQRRIHRDHERESLAYYQQGLSQHMQADRFRRERNMPTLTNGAAGSITLRAAHKRAQCGELYMLSLSLRDRLLKFCERVDERSFQYFRVDPKE